MLKRNCRQIAELRSQTADGKVRIVQRVQLWVHERMCRCAICRGFDAHLHSLRATVQEAFVELDARFAHLSLDETARCRMRKAMDEESSKHPDANE